MISFLVFITCMLGVFGAYLFATRASEAKRKRLQQRLAETLLYSSSTEDVEVQLARRELLSEIPSVNRALVRIQSALRLKRVLDQADLHITVTRLLMLSAMAGLLAALAVSVLTISLLLVAAAGRAAAAVPFMHVFYKRRQRLTAFLEALHMVATEMPEPIATEFRKTYEEQNLGLSLKLALDNLAERIPLLDLRLCITAIMIQRETGGNLAEILEKVGHTIRERFRILEDLKTLTTSSRLSAWILCGIPIFVALAVTFINPEYMSVLWYDPRGHKLILVASVMQLSGMLVVRKILKIKI